MTVSVDTLITRSSNRVGAIHLSLKLYMIELIKRCYKEGIYVQISSGFRSNEDQAHIYGQGRPQYTGMEKNTVPLVALFLKLNRGHPFTIMD